MERLNKEGLAYYHSLVKGLLDEKNIEIERITEEQIQALFELIYTITYTTTDNQILNLDWTSEYTHIHDGSKGMISSSQPITSIPAMAFLEQTTLLKITLPGCVESVGGDAFTGCSSLYQITTEVGVFNSDLDSTITFELSNGTVYIVTEVSEGPECVLPGTQILTSLDGTTKSVEELNIGDQVVTYNNGEMVEASIDKVINVVHNDYITLTLENGMSLSLSTDHAIKTMNGWKAYNPTITEVPDNVGTLTVDDHVLTNNGYIKINNIEYVNKPNTTMYNIGIKDHNDYFANGICVYECSESN